MQSNQEVANEIAQWHKEIVQPLIETLGIKPGQRSAVLKHISFGNYTKISENAALVQKWYARECGLRVSLVSHNKFGGKSGKPLEAWHNLELDWTSPKGEEEEMKRRLLQPSRRYKFEMGFALKLLKPRLSATTIEKIMSFTLEYVDHLKQKSTFLETKLRSDMPW